VPALIRILARAETGSLALTALKSIRTPDALAAVKRWERARG
jgi:hypothetical protein